MKNLPPGQFPPTTFLCNNNNYTRSHTPPVSSSQAQSIDPVSVTFGVAKKFHFGDHFTHEVELLFIERELNQKRSEGAGGKKLAQALSVWKTTRLMIEQSGLRDVSEWGSNSFVFHNIAIQLKYSPSYYMRLRDYLNAFGRFVARSNKTYYEPVTAPPAHMREKLQERFDATGNTTKAKPLTAALLEKKRHLLRSDHYNFLFITLWFGLRPSELTAVASVEVEDYKGIQLLVIYQKKLVMLKKDARYKRIPLLQPEQVEALALLRSGNYKLPLMTTMKRVFGKGFGVYSGRQGFTPMMLKFGYPLEVVSRWLGHAKVNMTEEHYVDAADVQRAALDSILSK